jgi:hypothetical protein
MNRQGYPFTWLAGRPESVLARLGKSCPSAPQTSLGSKGVRLMAERLKTTEHAPVLAEIRLRRAEDR